MKHDFWKGNCHMFFLTIFACGVNRHLPVTESHPPKFYVIKNKTESIATSEYIVLSKYDMQLLKMFFIFDEIISWVIFGGKYVPMFMPNFLELRIDVSIVNSPQHVCVIALNNTIALLFRQLRFQSALYDYYIIQ